MLAGASSIFGDVSLDAASSLSGVHTIQGNFSGTESAVVTNSGTVAPGDAPGTITVDGSYVQTSTGSLNIELDGANSSQYDQLVVTGNASLNGTLDVTLGNGFTLAAGETFQILTDGSTTGNFSTLLLPTLANGLTLS
jgi:hypothetical protein